MLCRGSMIYLFGCLRVQMFKKRRRRCVRLMKGESSGKNIKESQMVSGINRGLRKDRNVGAPLLGIRFLCSCKNTVGARGDAFNLLGFHARPATGKVLDLGPRGLRFRLGAKT